MALATDLSAIASRLLAFSALSALIDDEVHIDYPGDPAPGSATYNASNSEPFVYFGPVACVPRTGCGGMLCTIAIYAESFSADRIEALTIAEAVRDALRGYVLPSGQVVNFLRAGDSDSPFTPFSAFAEFQFMA